MSGGSQKFNMKTVLNSEQTESHVITNLMKYTEYEVFLMPFYQKIEGQPSNSLHVQERHLSKKVENNFTRK